MRQEDGAWRTKFADGRELSFHFATGEIRFTVVLAGREYERVLTIIGSQFSSYLVDWLAAEMPGMPAGSGDNTAVAAERFNRFLVETGASALSPEVYADFLRWMQTQPGRAQGTSLSEGARRSAASRAADFLGWSVGEGLLRGSQMGDIETRFTRAFQGFRARQNEAARTKWVPSAEVKRLYHAITLEVEAAERALHDRKLRSSYDPVLPLLPFPMLSGLQMAVRSAEWNSMRERYINHRPEQMWVHAPNKSAASLYMPPEVQRAWDLAAAWQRAYRTDWGAETYPILVPLLTGTQNRTHSGLSIPVVSGEIEVLDTLRLRNALERFYRKYFLLRDPNTGDPILYKTSRTTGRAAPFDLSFVDYRAAAITEYHRFEKNPEKVRLFARHESLQTTMDVYVRNTPDEKRDAMVNGVGPFSERVRLRVLGRVATQEEINAAKAEKGLVPGGACGEVLEGKRGCKRAVDCRLCERFLIDPRKREWFVGDSRRLVQLSNCAEQQNQLRTAQVNRAMAAINDSIVQTIDNYNAGLIAV